MPCLVTGGNIIKPTTSSEYIIIDIDNLILRGNADSFFQTFSLRGMENPDAAKRGLGQMILRDFQSVDVTALKPMDIPNDQRWDRAPPGNHGIFVSIDAVYAFHCTFQPVLDIVGMLYSNPKQIEMLDTWKYEVILSNYHPGNMFPSFCRVHPSKLT